MARSLSRRRFACGAALVSLLGSGCLDRLSGGDDHEHEHDDPPWEWGGIYDLEAGTYDYTYREGPDPDMRLAIVPAEDGDNHGLYHAGETATDLFETEDTAAVVTDGDAVEPSSDTLYRVDFAQSGDTTIELDVDADGPYALFTEHVPAEFDAELHSSSGPLEPVATERHSSHDHDGDDRHRTSSSDDRHDGEHDH